MSRNTGNSMASEAKEIREYTDKQESRCLNLLSRISRIQVDILNKHTEEQFSSLLNQPPKKFGFGYHQPSRTKLKTDTELPSSSRQSGSDGSNSSFVSAIGGTTSETPTTGPTTSSTFSKSKEGKKRKRNPIMDTPLWKMPEIMDMTQTTSNLESSLRQAAKGSLDLDETESSSGDSSCDETMFVHEDGGGGARRLTHYLPVEENPRYKFAGDRAKIIAMWTWLQDAIANLTYRIKQQDEFVKHLVTAKPAFQFEEFQVPVPQRPVNFRPPSNPALKDACIQIFTANNSQVPPTSTQVFYAGEISSQFITDAAGKVIQLAPPPKSEPSDKQQNPEIEQPSSSSSSTSPQSDRKTNSIVGGGLESLGLTIPINDDPTCTARRCMPLKPFKQRRIYQMGGIHNMASFCGRAPTLLCSCFGRTELCAVCTGRARKTKLIEIDTMNRKEIHEILNQNYHRVLSLPDETPIPSLIESALMREGWTTRKPKKKLKFKKLSLSWTKPKVQRHKPSRTTALLDNAKKRGRGRPRLPRGIDEYGHVVIKHPQKRPVPIPTPKNSPSTSQNWGKEDPGAGIGRRASYGGFRRTSFKISRKKYNSVSSAKGLSRRKEPRDAGNSDEESYLSPDFSTYDEYISDSFSNTKSDKRMSQSGRKLNQDYDIDNIVIPYSIASSTRVEKIEYKEILTPSWRIIADINPDDAESGEEEDYLKELNEETIKIRHDRCEVDEHKRFNSFVDKSSTRRGRRVDSRTESFDHPSSNPTSPSAEVLPEVTAPISPGPSEADDLCPDTLDVKQGPSRKRSISFTSLRKEDDEIEEIPGPPPFEVRKFPLTDEEYDSISEELSQDEIGRIGRRHTKSGGYFGFGTEEIYEKKVKKEHGIGIMTIDSDPEELNDPDWQRSFEKM